MRPLVEPPPTLRCMCGGELRPKLIEPADRTYVKQREIFVCTNCSREQTLLSDRNPYVAFHSPKGIDVNSGRRSGALICQRGADVSELHTGLAIP